MLSVISLKLPSNWNELYYKILIAFAQYGEEALKDCKATCTEKNTHIVDCYNIFNAAVAAYTIGKTKQANLLYNYLVRQFEIYYPNITVSAKYLYVVLLNAEQITALDSKTTAQKLAYLEDEFNDENKVYYNTNPLLLEGITVDTGDGEGIFIYAPNDEIGDVVVVDEIYANKVDDNEHVFYHTNYSIFEDELVTINFE